MCRGEVWSTEQRLLGCCFRSELTARITSSIRMERTLSVQGRWNVQTLPLLRSFRPTR